jgi:hypothetical protein
MTSRKSGGFSISLSGRNFLCTHRLAFLCSGYAVAGPRPAGAVAVSYCRAEVVRTLMLHDHAACAPLHPQAHSPVALALAISCMTASYDAKGLYGTWGPA